jgi:hypothetical protein
MEKVASELNWSALACRAFEKALGEIATNKEEKNMADVIERLRATRNEAADEAYQTGIEAGQEWAKDTAEVKELRNLERLRDKLQNDWASYFGSAGSPPYSTCHRLAFAIQPEHDRDREMADEFWSCAVGDDGETEANIQDDSFLRGFADGALDIWKNVKDKI